MSDMFESLEFNMREEAEKINPTKAIMASQLECEQRFESFVAKNPERVEFLSDDIRSVADKYAAKYDIPSETIYKATVTHLKEAAVKNANPVDPFAGKDEAHSDLINDYVGYNMNLEQIGRYWNQYKPLVDATLQGSYEEEQTEQLSAELEHLKEELQGIGGEEEGNSTYWNLEEQISDALTSLYRHQERQTFSSVARESKECNCWDGYKRVPGTKPCTPGSCKKCDADRDKKKAAFILENADAIVPEWIQKNAGWREMLRGFMDRQTGQVNQFDPMSAPDWSSKDKPLPDRARKMQEQGMLDQQPTQEIGLANKTFSEGDNLTGPAVSIGEEDFDSLSEADRRQKEFEEKTRGMQQRGDVPEQSRRRKLPEGDYGYLRGASIEDSLADFYVAQGIPEKTASILVEAVGEMAQLQTNEPGLPVSANDPDSINIDKEIGGSEGDKYRNIDVEETSKAIGLDSQEFTDFGDPVREFVQPGGEAPYADNDERTEKNKDKYKGEADRSKMDGKGVKQEDNAPKKSSTKESGDNPKSPYSMSGFGDKNNVPSYNSDYMNYDDKIKKLVEDGMTEEEAKEYLNYKKKDYQKKDSASVKEASDLSLVPPEGVRNAAKRGIKYHSEGKAGDGFESATLARAKRIAAGEELTSEHVKRMHSFFERHAGGRSQKAKQGEVTPWDVAWLAWGGNAGRTWAASKVKQMENSKKSSTPLNFDTIDGEVEKLMSKGMTPEQAVQSLGVYNETNEPQGWGGSKN